MQGHTNAPHTETVILSFAVPSFRVAEAVQAMRGLGFEPAQESVPWREVLPYSDEYLAHVTAKE